MNIQRLFNMKPMLLQLVNLGNCEFLGFCIGEVHPSHSTAGLDRPLGLNEERAPRISRLSPQEGGKVVSPTHQLSSHPSRIKVKYSA